MFRSTKHRTSNVIDLSDFRRGIVYTSNPESLPPDALITGTNIEFDNITGELKTVAGYRVRMRHETPIIAAVYDEIHNTILFVADVGKKVRGNLYSYDRTTDMKTLIGELSGREKPVFCFYGRAVLIASGGLLQAYGVSSLFPVGDVGEGLPITTLVTAGNMGFATINTQAPCNIVFQRNGRVVVSCTVSANITTYGDEGNPIIKDCKDYLRYSGTGDFLNWEFDTQAANAKFIEVGYQDSGDIVAIVPLSQDILVFKSNNILYRVIGEYESKDWNVKEISRGVNCMNAFCAISAANDVFFMGQYGFHSLATVQEYGSIKSNEVGRNINSVLAPTMSQDARVWHIPTKQQAWLKPNKNGSVYIYHYFTRSADWVGSFTHRLFTQDLIDLMLIQENMWGVIGDTIVEFDDELSTDDGVEKEALIGTKLFSTAADVVIKKVELYWFPTTEGTGVVQIGDIWLPFVFEQGGIEIYGDEEDIFGDYDDIWEKPVTEKYERFNYRVDEFDVKILIQSGNITIRKIIIHVAEVGS